uniref:peptidylprolyl isomerase n=1 Tax=Loxodonta africana TaxID=9785 RepID=G3UH85_LOXAF
FLPKFPKVGENASALCTGDARFGYKDYSFTELLPWNKGNKTICQGGDFTSLAGSGRQVHLWGEYADESFILKHMNFGMVTMENATPKVNGSWFFICTAESDWLNDNHIPFGMNIVEVMECFESRIAKTNRKIAKCMQLP